MLGYLFRFGTDAYGQTILLGANWDLFWWCLAAGLAFAVVYAVTYPFLKRHRMQMAQRIAREITNAKP
jgi:hypothetical protein